ncbi:MAG: DoxX family protein [Chlamydiales bacterium]
MGKKTKKIWFKHLYYGIIQAENFLGHLLLFIIRFYWGGLLTLMGFGKFTNPVIFADFLSLFSIPAPLFIAYLIASFEIIGGISLFIGCFSRISAIFMIFLFIGIYLVAYQEALMTIFSNPSLFIHEEPFLYLYSTLIICCFGPGFISIDYWIEKKPGKIKSINQS